MTAEASARSVSPSRIRALDGIRGLAILTVIFGHIIRQRFPEDSFAYWVTVPIRTPDLGVQIFFVLSGFLITGILLRERERAGRISLRGFYVRRSWRILPAYLVFLGFAAAMCAAGLMSATSGDLIVAGLFASNFFPSGETWLLHTWSLSVEEQFYLLWPFVLMLIGRRASIRICVAIIAFSPVYRTVMHFVTGSTDMWWTQNRADQLMIGAGLALLTTNRPDTLSKIADWVRRRHAIAAALVFLSLTSFAGEFLGGIWWITVAPALAGLSAGVLIVAATDDRNARLMSFLRFRPLVWIGTISFSLYLWQQIFTQDAVLPLQYGLTLMLVVATISYYLIERPALILKDRASGKSAANSR